LQRINQAIEQTQDLVAFAKALAVHVYDATQAFPRSELYGLTAQLRRAAVSIPSNVAEGQGRLTSGEFLHFLGQARGSLLEFDTQLAIAFDLQYLERETYLKLDFTFCQTNNSRYERAMVPSRWDEPRQQAHNSRGYKGGDL